MSIVLLPDLAREGAERLAREADGLRGRAWPRGALAEVSRCLLELARLHAQGWEGVQARLSEEGYETGALAKACRALQASDKLIVGIADLLTQAAADPRPRSEGRADVGKLKEATAIVAACRPQVAEVLAWATRPPSPIDPARLAASDDDFAAGRYVSGDQFLAQIRSRKAP